MINTFVVLRYIFCISASLIIKGGNMIFPKIRKLDGRIIKTGFLTSQRNLFLELLEETPNNLCYLNLDGIDLSGIDFTKYNKRYGCLMIRNSSIRNANLSGSNLDEVDFLYTDFANSNLDNTSVKKTMFSEGNLQNVSSDGVDWMKAKLQ